MKKTAKRFSRCVLAALVLGSLIGTTAQADIIYLVNQTITGPLNGKLGNPLQTNSVIGSITTDGTIGVLHTANITNWNLNLIDVNNSLYNIGLTKSNSLISVDLGSVLNANATDLFFDFTSTGAFGFQASSPGAGSGFHYWCLSHNWIGCLDGSSIAPGNVYAGLAGDDLVGAATGTQGLVGNAPLNQPGAPTSVPEPASLALLGLGLAGLGFSRRRKA